MTAFLCTARQLLRRWSWLLLFVAGLFTYKLQIYWQVEAAAREARTAGEAQVLETFQHGTRKEWMAAVRALKDNTAQAAAAEAAKIVDPSLVYSKLSIAVGVFCLINLLAWAALNMVLPVLADWAKGRYSQADKAAAVGLDSPVVGFKRTFLLLAGIDRIRVYFLGFGMQIAAAAFAVFAASYIQ